MTAATVSIPGREEALFKWIDTLPDSPISRSGVSRRHNTAPQYVHAGPVRVSVKHAMSGEELTEVELQSEDKVALLYEAVSSFLGGGRVRLFLDSMESPLEKVVTLAEAGLEDGAEVSVVRIGDCLAASASSDRTVRVWNVDTGECVRSLEGHGGIVNSVRFSSDRRWVLTASADGLVRLWAADTGYCRQTFNVSKDSVRCATFSPDLRLMLSASNDRLAKLWSLEDGSCLQTLSGHSGAVRSVNFSPDGTRALTASDDRTARLWRLDGSSSERSEFILRGHTGFVISAVFVPRDGALRVLTASGDKSMRLWSASTGQCLQTLLGHEGAVRSIACSNDGKRALTASDDRTAKLWSVEDGCCLRTIAAHTDLLTSADISDDGCIGITGSGDRVVRIWDLETGDCKHTLAGHWGVISSVAMFGQLW